MSFVHRSPLPGTKPVPFSKLAAEVPAYAYDWPVQADNPAKASGLAATDLATELAHKHWRKTQVQGGETEYTYYDKGKLHIVWSAVTGIVNTVRQIRAWCPQCGVRCSPRAASTRMGQCL